MAMPGFEVGAVKKALNKLVNYGFDKAHLGVVEGLTTNVINHLPFVLSLSREACRRSSAHSCFDKLNTNDFWITKVPKR